MTIEEDLLRVLELVELRGVLAFPSQQLPVLAEPLVAVGVQNRQMQPMLHGYRIVEQTVFLDVYAAYRGGAQCCAEAADRIEALLCKGLADYCVTRIHRGEMYYDAPSDCFRLRISAELSSYEEEEV